MEKQNDLKDMENVALRRRENKTGRRNIKLTKSEQLDIRRNTRLYRAVELFLDVNVSHSWEEIANELQITTRTLKNMVKTEEFVKAYNEYYEELTSDPRRRASIISLNNLLPTAIKELEKLITEDAPPSVKFQAIKEIIRLNNVNGDVGKKSDRNELAEFLRNAGVININIGANKDQKEFEAMITKHGYEHAVDGKFTDVETPLLLDGETEED